MAAEWESGEWWIYGHDFGSKVLTWEEEDRIDAAKKKVREAEIFLAKAEASYTKIKEGLLAKIPTREGMATMAKRRGIRVFGNHDREQIACVFASHFSGVVRARHAVHFAESELIQVEMDIPFARCTIGRCVLESAERAKRIREALAAAGVPLNQYGRKWANRVLRPLGLLEVDSRAYDLSRVKK